MMVTDTTHLMDYKVLLVVLCLSCSLCTAVFTIDSVTLTSTATDSNNDGLPDTRQETTFNLLSNVTYSLDPGSSRVEVVLTRPGSVLNRDPVCTTLIDGTVIGVCTTPSFTSSDIAWNVNNIAVTTATSLVNSTTSAYVTGSGELQIMVTLTYESSVGISGETVMISQPVSVNSQWAKSSQLFTLDTKIVNDTSGDVTVNGTQQNYTVNLVGPFLGSSVRLPPSTSVSVGDTVSVAVNIGHKPSSTESAYNVLVSYDIMCYSYEAHCY